MSDYDEKKRRSLWASDMIEVVEVMKALDSPAITKHVYDARMTVIRDDGEDLAEVWWDSESESWLCDWLRGSGA